MARGEHRFDPSERFYDPFDQIRDEFRYRHGILAAEELLEAYRVASARVRASLILLLNQIMSYGARFAGWSVPLLEEERRTGQVIFQWSRWLSDRGCLHREALGRFAERQPMTCLMPEDLQPLPR